MSYTARSRVFVRLLLVSLSINALVLALASGSPATAQSVQATHSTIATASDTLDADTTPTPQDTKVTLCHASSSRSNPYEAIDVSIDSVENAFSVHGHGGHTGLIYPAEGWGDIIPPFDYGSIQYPGMNWTDTGQAIWGAGCQVPADTPTPTATPTDTSTPTSTPTATPTDTSTPTPTPTATPTDTSTPTPTPTPEDIEVTLCQRTSSRSNPYEAIDVSIDSEENAISVHGHADETGPIFPADDWGDIIPPFDYGSIHYAGMNWTEAGQAIWNAGCQVPPEPPVHMPGLIQGNKTSSLYTDANMDGQVSPGDTLVYTISVRNIGGEVVTDVVFLDTLDPNTMLVVGSVQTTSGTITLGNTPGDTSVEVNIGSVPPSDQPGAIITFLAVIANPFPASAQQVSNQGVISSTRGVTVTFDGNDVLQPEITPVHTTVGLEITPVAPQCVLPGSTFSITWWITNTGNVALTFGQLSSIVSGSGTAWATQDLAPIAASSAVSVEQPIHVIQPVDYGAEVITVTTEVVTTTPPVANSVAAVKASQQVTSVTTTIGICAPDLRGATAVVTSSKVFAYEVLTYTWVLKNTGNADAIHTNAVLTPTNSPLLGFADALTATSGTAVWNVAANRVEWSGDLHMSDVVTIEFTTQSVFGLPHASLADPFVVSHSWRPTFYGTANYQYPYKLFFMLVLRNSTP